MSAEAGLEVLGALMNRGELQSRAHIRVTAGGLLNQQANAHIAGDGGVSLQLGTLSNAGTIAAQGSALTVRSTGEVDNTGASSAPDRPPCRWMAR